MKMDQSKTDASGPLTNLAEALRLDPSLAERIGEVVVMGGSIDVPGNIAPAWPNGTSGSTRPPPEKWSPPGCRCA